MGKVLKVTEAKKDFEQLSEQATAGTKWLLEDLPFLVAEQVKILIKLGEPDMSWVPEEYKDFLGHEDILFPDARTKESRSNHGKQSAILVWVVAIGAFHPHGIAIFGHHYEVADEAE